MTSKTAAPKRIDEELGKRPDESSRSAIYTAIMAILVGISISLGLIMGGFHLMGNRYVFQ
jgi:hypothetical protein